MTIKKLRLIGIFYIINKSDLTCFLPLKIEGQELAFSASWFFNPGHCSSSRSANLFSVLVHVRIVVFFPLCLHYLKKILAHGFNDDISSEWIFKVFQITLVISKSRLSHRHHCSFSVN